MSEAPKTRTWVLVFGCHKRDDLGRLTGLTDSMEINAESVEGAIEIFRQYFKNTTTNPVLAVFPL